MSRQAVCMNSAIATDIAINDDRVVSFNSIIDEPFAILEKKQNGIVLEKIVGLRFCLDAIEKEIISMSKMNVSA
jgi:hypothetical protein